MLSTIDGKKLNNTQNVKIKKSNHVSMYYIKLLLLSHLLHMKLERNFPLKKKQNEQKLLFLVTKKNE